MFYTSTRGGTELVSAQTIARGIADDGGLFVPQEFPPVSESFFQRLIPMDYRARAAEVLSLYLTDFTPDEIRHCVDGAYTGTFENEQPAPLKEVTPGMNLLELWHGPTCAFKDLALQLLPYLLTVSAEKTDPGRTKVILVATSGDTGKAALDGFADVPGTRIIVFYPVDGVSAMQKLQMQTQTGDNVAVCAIKGNFDDAQSGVKAIFADPDMHAFLAEKKMDFSSANSINFGRLVPQIVYYISAYCDMLRDGKVKSGEPVNVCVPTGNFGNILAAYYAAQMGMPVKKFICASNRNNVLTDFIRTGVYDRNRTFYPTTSPSMDILISSNLERLLYHLYDGDTGAIRQLMNQLRTDGKYTVRQDVLTRLQKDFYAGFCDDETVTETIRDLFAKQQYLCDTHTAVAVNVYRQYVQESGDDTPCIIASTASPYKFAPAVLPAVTNDTLPDDEFAMTEKLFAVTGLPIPAPIASLRGKEVLHPAVTEKTGMTKFIQDFLA